MCGIVGYIGNKPNVDSVLDGLLALEYRGYDSAGVAMIAENGTAESDKQVGQVSNLVQSIKSRGLNGKNVIGHTRWATHGEPTVANAHPHYNAEQDIFVVHNGIIENHTQLRYELISHGYTFVTQTDTEVVAHLLDYYGKKMPFDKAFIAALRRLEGAYALAVISKSQPDKLFAAKISSPMVIGIGYDCYFVASDPSAILEHTDKVIYIEDFEAVELTPTSHKIIHIKDDCEISRAPETIPNDIQKAQLGEYPHFMLKEIYEAPEVVRSATRGRVKADSGIVKLGGLENVARQLNYIDRLVIVACGTSYYAGMIGEYLIEELAGIPVEVQLASEFKYRTEPFSRGTAVLVVSQSGETADSLAALKKIEDFGVLKLGVVNVAGSAIARLTDAGVYCHAGPELAVASTKAFIAQVTVLTQIALHLSKSSPLFAPLLKGLDALPELVQATLKIDKDVADIARKYAGCRDFLYIGRGYMYPVALEGALKLKELSYIHAEGYAAGEMKHGPLAMIDENFPTIALVPKNELYDKTLSNVAEIRSRKGPIIAIATEGDQEISAIADDVIFIPETLPQLEPIIASIPLQLFAYHVAVQNGHNVDRPRNLAKSVTVE